MTDREILLAAVIAAPDDDLPRLVYSDYLEEHGDDEFAGFIRDQIAVARSEPWEPTAVRAAYFRPQVVGGSSWIDRLPDVGSGTSLNWHPDRAYHRGFGSGLKVLFPPALVEAGESLFRAAPVDHLWLHAGTLDDWRQLAWANFLPRVRGLHFAGLRTPVEAVTELLYGPRAAGVREITFTRADGPGMPEVLRRVVRSDSAARLEALELRTGPDDADELLMYLTAGTLPRLKRLALSHLSLRETFLGTLFPQSLMAGLESIDLSGNRLGSMNGRHLGRQLATAPKLATLVLRGCDFDAGHCGRMIAQLPPGILRSLDLCENPLGPDGVGGFVRRAAVTGLRSLRLAQTGIDASGLYSLVRGPFWPKLVELDLRQNLLTADSIVPLLDAVRPVELTALDLRGNALEDEAVDLLRERYGSAVLSDSVVGEPGT